MSSKHNLWKLMVHQQSFSKENVIIQGDYPGLEVGDIIEVYHPTGTYSRLLVKVNAINRTSNNLQKGSISIISSLASSFCLRQYNDVCVSKVETNAVTLDMLELIFKDQFVTRSDAWRLHQSLIGSCVYFCNKVNFISMRIQVNEMWMGGDKVACGVVGEKTKVVYRSQSAKFHIFVQMSAEMWEFDYSGDLFFEKAIMAFLQDLFNKWKDQDLNCNHQVVIVLFSRTYFDGIVSIDEFPKEKQKEVLCSHDGRFYQDFYKIIRQSEKHDNLQNVILDLKQSFHGYPLYVDCQQPFGSTLHQVSPKGLGKNSRAADGNLLEAINLSLNVFEKDYIDCNLEETNCTCLVITPSTGVFKVDEELAILTRKRLIENEVGIDLVCLAEQPLHTVPLLKFFPSKGGADHQDIYNVPQWINLSYYSKPQSNSSVFVPRMSVPQKSQEMVLERNMSARLEDIDYDEFDSKVFDYAKAKHKFTAPKLPWKNTTFDSTSLNSSPEVSKSMSNVIVKKLSLQEDPQVHSLFRSMSEEPVTLAVTGSFDDLKFTMGSDKEDTPTMSAEHIHTVPSDSSLAVKQLNLNPFKPQSIASAITLFKHRWLHTFPTNLTSGLAMQEHHQKVNLDDDEPSTKSPAPEVEEAALATVEVRKKMLSHDSFEENDGSLQDTLVEEDLKSVGSSSTQASSKKNAHHDEDWTATIITGVDWKSLCMPACLPLSIDYFPDEKNLNSIYFEYHYTMVLEDIQNMGLDDNERIPKDSSRFDRSTIPPDKKFEEMISQRIAQGFQFVTKPDVIRILKLKNKGLQSMLFDMTKEYVLSMGLTIHHLKLENSEVHVTRYSLREPIIPRPINYRYNIWPHNCLQYSQASAEFHYEAGDKYNWNNLDRYICETEKEYGQLNEHMRYWRTRFLLLPMRRTPFAPREVDGMERIEGFLRFLEGVNKIKRGNHNRQLFSCRKKTTHRKSSMDQIKSERSVTPDRSEKRDQRKEERRSSPMQIIDAQDSSKDLDLSSTPRTSSSCTQDEPNDMPPENILSITSPLHDIIKAMTSSKYGLYFLPKQDNLCDFTFISAEAVAWMIKSIDGCNTKEDAVALGQRLLHAKLIMHASRSASQSFIDGFFLYFIKIEIKEDDSDKTGYSNSKEKEEELLKSYNIQWLEAAVWRDDEEETVATFLLEELSPPEFLHVRKSRYDISNNTEGASVPLYKFMEYNMDAQSKSKRSEWCALSYHGNYHPNKCAYAIEMNWMVASGCIIAELVQKWSHKATSCGVHIVPAPMCAFPGSNIRCSRNPFRKSPFVPLNIDCLLKDGQRHLFEDYNPKTWSRRMFLFQEAILRKFDFLRDLPQTAPESTLHGSKSSTYQYIHASGSLLIKINGTVFGKDSRSPTLIEDDIVESPFRKTRKKTKKSFETQPPDFDYDEKYKDIHGFFWVYNYALSKKWRTSVTGDVKSAKRYIAQTFSDFCSNKNDQLLDFWRDSCRIFLAKKQEYEQK